MVSELKMPFDCGPRDRSTEELRKTMLEFAKRQDNGLKEAFINLLKKRFGEDYDRDYPLQPLAEEHEKTQELQRAQESSADDLLPMENSKIPLGNFIEQVACVPTSEAFSKPLGNIGEYLVSSQILKPTLETASDPRRSQVKERNYKARKRKIGNEDQVTSATPDFKSL